ncbi:type I DNA topoisomerase [Thalassotalea piscium]
MPKSDDKLFTQHEHALEKAHDVCPSCGCELVIKHSKAGSFYGCSSYPNCQYTRPVVEHERVEDKILVGSECPKCHHELAVKQGRYGMFIGCSNFPECHHIEDTHQHEDAGVACPQCAAQGKQSELIERTNRFGKTFYSCEQYPKCKYVVNYRPIQEKCPKCQWTILVERKMSSGNVIICPEKKCDYKRKSV